MPAYDTEKTELEAFTFQLRAMNTPITCTLPCRSEEEADQLQQQASSWFHYVEERFSRFLPHSELVQLNERAGSIFMLSSAMFEVLQLAEHYRTLTEGAFDPFIHEALRQSGYDQSFEKLAAYDGSRLITAKQHDTRGSHPTQLNPSMKSVQLPPGTSIDLGGIVKSWAVKRLAAWLRRQYRLPFGLVNAGGDLIVWGGAKPPEPWRIGIEHPWESSTAIGTLLLRDGASATSSTLGRRWQTSRGSMHHLIDPLTMQPADSDIVQCTTCGEDPIACEIWAKTLCILGSETGLALLARAQAPVEALLFGREQEIIFYGASSSVGTVWQHVPITKFA